MKIAILGAGFTGLAAAYRLTKQGHSVTVFEKDPQAGGLAIGYKESQWDWSLEKHYHHWFTNDKSVLDLAKEINYEVVIKRPKTSTFVDGGIYQFDSPKTVLMFPKLTFIDRLRTAITIGILRYNPMWKPLEKFRAEPFLKTMIGKSGYKTIWEPLMVNKLGKYADVVSLAWFWARISKRTPSLAYPAGGFLHFADALVEKIKKQNGTILFNTEVVELSSDLKPKVTLRNENGKVQTETFDAVIVTLPSFLFSKIAPALPAQYVKMLSNLKGIGAINMVLRLKEEFMHDNTYWLNMCDINSPILAIVEHTHFMDKEHYNNENLVYVGNYMPTDNPLFSASPDQLLKRYDPYLKKINPNYKKNLIDFKVFHAPFAQPIIPRNYSSQIPPIKTPLQNVYLANMQQVYPWDRGTNYAVELGEKVAGMITENNEK